MDASVLVTALADDGADGERARSHLGDERLAAPAVIDLEVVAAWRRLCAAGRLSDDRARLAMTDLAELPLERVDHGPLLARCWELRDTMTIYDAAYVALAEALATALLTADQRLANAPGPRCTVELIH